MKNIYKKSKGDNLVADENFSFAFCVLSGKNNDKKIKRVEGALRNKGEGPFLLLIINEKQKELLSRLGIEMYMDKHHPVPRYLWRNLEWFISQHYHKKIKDYSRYKRIDEIVRKFFSIEIENMGDKISFLESLKNDKDYQTVYSIPRSLHRAYNQAFCNLKPMDITKEISSIFDYNNYNKKREKSILTLLYFVSVMENDDFEFRIKDTIEKRLDNNGILIMKDILEMLKIDKDMVIKYIEIIFFPRKYESMNVFFDFLESIKDL